MSETKERNEEHLKNPKVGDYWHEMCIPVCVVVYVTPNHVVYCKARKDKGHLEEGRTWDLEVLVLSMRHEFEQWLSYGSTKGTWADVIPEHHKWVGIESGFVKG